MTAMPCGKKKHSNATSQSHRATGPLVAIDETVLSLRMATTNKSAKSHRPSSRRRALVGLALIGQPELSFMVSGRPASRGKRGPSLQILHHQKVDACLMTAVLQRAPTGPYKARVWCLRSGPSRCAIIVLRKASLTGTYDGLRRTSPGAKIAVHGRAAKVGGRPEKKRIRALAPA